MNKLTIALMIVLTFFVAHKITEADESRLGWEGIGPRWMYEGLECFYVGPLQSTGHSGFSFGFNWQWHPGAIEFWPDRTFFKGSEVYFDGRVGIGNTTPAYKLHVNGKAVSGVDCDAPGDYATVGGGEDNTASGFYATVGGGQSNTALDDCSTIGGGMGNSAEASYTTVGGGLNNKASGSFATVSGGRDNTAMHLYSFAAGRRAKANNQGCFVWGDSTDSDVACNTANRWVARCSGGVYFYTNSTLSSGVYVNAGGGSWNSVSDRNKKANLEPVDGLDVLNSLAEVPISTWNYKTQDPSIRHMGPMAQDLYAAFKLGCSDKSIATIDADGVALAAIQGLYKLFKEKVGVLEKENSVLKRRIENLERVKK